MSSIAPVAAIAATALLCGLAIFQTALVVGAPIGHFAWGGQHRVLPTSYRIASLLAALVYVAIVIVVLDRAEHISVVEDGSSKVAAWGIAVFFAAGIPLNAISRSRPERYTMTPLVTILTILTAIVAIGR